MGAWTTLTTSSRLHPVLESTWCWLLVLTFAASPVAAFLFANPQLAPEISCGVSTSRSCRHQQPALLPSKLRLAPRTVSMAAADEWVQDAVLSNNMGVLTLNRPKALNAADKVVTEALLKKLGAWETSGEVKAMVLRSTSERAFCSGGDVRAIALDLTADSASQTPYVALSNEYRLLCKLQRWSESPELDIPSVAIMDGVTMGFGVGLACNTRYRVFTERTLLAMPENAIGLFPDIGFAYLMRHHPALGLYLALTGSRIGAKASPPADIHAIGLGTHYVPADKVAALVEALENSDLTKLSADAVISGILADYSQDCPGPSNFDKLRPLISRCFDSRSKPHVQDIIHALEQEAVGSSEDAATASRAAITAMHMASPTSLEVTLAHFREIRSLMEQDTPPALHEVLRTEYRLATRMCQRPDFFEGVRARLIDKDNAPVWAPASLDDVDEASVATCFAPMSPLAELDTSDGVKKARVE